jgi:SAM-dependent methyltransferase
MDRPHYKTWIRTRPLVILALFVTVFLVLSLLAFWSPFFLLFLFPAAIFAYILLIVGMSRWRLSKSGGDYQRRVHQLLVTRVLGDRVLDIGCGSAHLLAEIARAHPSASLVGLDYWGDDWEYSEELCLANFRAEGLEGRATFIRGSASRLPHDLGTFATVVSCLTFHEVSDIEDKTVCIGEALSLLKPGGRFAFIDLFADRKLYPDPTAVDAAITESGGLVSERLPISELINLPFPLKHRRVLKHAELVAGEKARAST